MSRLLELHVLETHDSLFLLLAKKQKMVLNVNHHHFIFLFISSSFATQEKKERKEERKERWHLTLTFVFEPFSCIQYECLVEGCGQKFARDRDRKKHLVRFHQYPEGMLM